MSYVCAYSSVQLDKRRVEKEFTEGGTTDNVGGDVIYLNVSLEVCLLRRRISVCCVWSHAPVY